MTLEWDEDARARLERRLAELEPALDADAERRRTELRARIEGELAKGARARVTVGDVDAVVDALSRAAPVSAGTTRVKSGLSGLASLWLLVACVLGPAFVLAVELSTHMCAEEFFDPLPTLAHVLAVAWVPVAAALALYAARERPSATVVNWTSLGLGFALVVAGVYFLAYLPLLPLAIFALLAAGLGFLPLTPIACFPTLCVLATLLARRARGHGMPQGAQIWSGVLAGGLFFAALEAPAVLTRRWIASTVNGVAEERAEALGMLRAFGSEELLLRLASGDSEAALGPFWLLTGARIPVSTTDARNVWYRIHGEPFRGPLRGREGDGLFGDRRFDEFDPDTGGTTVGAGARGLELRSSRLDAAVDGTAGVAYVEWTLELANTNAWGTVEGRALVELPDEAVVSRATLWVDGEEREAAYAGKAATRAAYQRVAVAQRRDPLLVTSAGDDLVLAQVFPVNAGSTMKWKFGITVPLPVDATSARVPLPRIVDRNFGLGASLAHTVWILSHEELASDVLAVAKNASGFEARGELAAAALDAAGTPPSVTVRREDVPGVEHAREDGSAVVCAFERASPADAAPPVFVVEGSRALRAEKDAIERELRAAFPGRTSFVYVASDAGARLVELGPETAQGAIADAAEWAGGVDDVPALEAAWDRARGLGVDVVWLSGPQPVLLSGMEGLAQRFERDPAGPRVVVVAFAPGENRVLFELADDARIERVPFEGDVAAALRRAVRPPAIERRWSLVASPAEHARAGPEHLEALYASGRVEELLLATPPRREEALELAARHHLVTRVSGAVVLENAQQFADNALSPADAQSLPSVPEPEIVALACVVLAAALVFALRRRRSAFA